MTTVVFRRPQRRPPPPMPGGEIELREPPEIPKIRKDMSQALMILPMLAGGGAMMFVFSGVGTGGQSSPIRWIIGGLFGISMLGMAVMNIGRPQMGKKAELNDERRDYLRYLGQARKEARAAALAQRKAMFWRHPDPEALWSTAVSKRLWERRTSDGDFEALEQDVIALATRGLNYGVHIVLGASRWGEIRAALRDLLGPKLELRLGDPTDSEMDRKSAMVAKISGAWTGTAAPRVRLLPLTYPAADLPAADLASSPAGIPFGIRESDLSPVYLDFNTDPHFLCFGDVESGKTGLLRLLLAGITKRYTPDQARIIVADYRRTLLEVADSPHMLGYATATTALAPMLKDVADSMQKRLPGPDVTPDQLRNRSWWKGPELFIVVDDYDLVVTPSGNPLAVLSDVLPQAHDIGLHLIVVRASGGASRATYEPVIQRLRELGSPGLAMSTSRDEVAWLPEADLDVTSQTPVMQG